ncbi:winged helix DNA-binding protein [Alteraurantiacibacter buctensis]|uniref:Winged helix DNA-binding protein n=1 Tax=Alteraurantiacibacter buctensis TaxID=1503981 RepID=A0A844Z247_9SPHN|nr:winged helix DNA-binding protein [Alteraurantiacibacter buctensis]MXO73306.1 winged helix DNA-binding protein [Alteraurantiacibacter buctensis]
MSSSRQEIIDRLATEWKPEAMRDLAAMLLRLADSIDQNWQPSNVRSIYRWPSSLARIERNSVNLAMKARVISTQRARRRDYVSTNLLGEPAWDMMLDLFVQYAGGAKVSTTSLCIASQVPTSTALRYIALLEETGYVQRSQSETDKRVTFVSLTELGVMSMGNYLEQY